MSRQTKNHVPYPLFVVSALQADHPRRQAGRCCSRSLGMIVFSVIFGKVGSRPTSGTAWNVALPISSDA